MGNTAGGAAPTAAKRRFTLSIWARLLTVGPLVFLGLPAAHAGAAGTISASAVTTLSALEGADLGNPVVATFTDSTSETYTATIAWGDGGSSTGTVDTSTSPYTVSGTHTYAEDGSFTVSVTIAGANSSNHDTVSDTAKITETQIQLTTILRPPNYAGQRPEAPEGHPLLWEVRIQDPNSAESLAEYSAHIDWGDGSTDVLTSTPSPAGQIQLDPVYGPVVHALHTYFDEGTFPGQIAVFDDGVAAGQIALPQSFQPLSVGDALVVAVAPRLNTVEGQTVSGTIATFTDANPNATVADFTPVTQPPPPNLPIPEGKVVIGWGDPDPSHPGQTQTSVASVSQNPDGSFNVVGNHVYAEEGSYNLNVIVSDEGKAVSNAHTTATVTDASLSASGLAIARPRAPPTT